MKRFLTVLLVLALLCPALALADGPLLLVELPETAQLVEDVQFDDGDIIQTYLLDTDALVGLLRFANFDLTLEELVESEWTGHGELSALPLVQVGAYPAQGLRFAWVQEDEAIDVTLVLVEADAQTLLLQAAFPQAMGADAIDAAVQAMLDSLDVFTDGAPVSDEAEVG